MSPYIATLILLWGLFDLSSVEPVTASHRHFHRHHRLSNYGLEESVPRQLSMRRLPAEPNRRWRSLDPWTQGDETGHSRVRTKRQYTDIEKFRSHMYQMEANQAKDASLCRYSVTPMQPYQDENGTFILKGLNEIKCKHLGSPCHTGKPHCCIQIITPITMEYIDKGKKYSWSENINTGCVCAHHKIPNGTSRLPK